MRRAVSDTQLACETLTHGEHHSATGPPESFELSHSHSSKGRRRRKDTHGLSAATLKLELSKAIQTSLRHVHERRAQQPATMQSTQAGDSSSHSIPHSPQATAPASFPEQDNPVRVALAKSFPKVASPPNTATAAAASCRTFSPEEACSMDLGKCSSSDGTDSKMQRGNSAPQPPTPDAVCEGPLRRSSDEEALERSDNSCSTMSSLTISGDEGGPLQFWPCRRSGSGSGSSHSRFTSTSGRSSEDSGLGTSRNGGRSSYEGSRTSDSDRSETTTPFVRASSASVPYTSIDSFRTAGSSQREVAIMDADCCGDSGCVLLRSGSQPLQPSVAAGPRSSRADGSLGSLLNKQGRSSSNEDGSRKWACLSDGQAAVQLFWRLNHARQTVDFVRRQRAMFSRLDKLRLTIPQALGQLDTLREYEAALLGEGVGSQGSHGLGLAAHAFQTAEACRLAHPEADWFALAGLLHGLGKLLAHSSFGSESQWAVCGESFPVGCQHDAGITAAEYFCVNPDRRRRVYNTPTGMYSRGCGLRNVLMSWGAPEYLHLVLSVNAGASIPPPTLWLLRHAKFCTLGHGGYSQLLDDFDRSMLPWLHEFQELSSYTKRELPGRLEGPALEQHYDALLAKYLPAGPLRW